MDDTSTTNWPSTGMDNTSTTNWPPTGMDNTSTTNWPSTGMDNTSTTNWTGLTYWPSYPTTYYAWATSGPTNYPYTISGNLELELSVDTTFVLICGILVFLMQTGFMFLEVGCIRNGRLASVLMKNTLDLCITSICYWAFGWCFTWGKDWGGFIGTTDWFATSLEDDFNGVTRPYYGLGYAYLFIETGLATSCGTIVSGAVAERIEQLPYIVNAIVMASVTYPVPCHWLWGTNGWGATSDGWYWDTPDSLFGVAVIDSSGASVTHVVGGATALVAAAILGPRVGRFDVGGRARNFTRADQTFVTFGLTLLWFSWYGYTAGGVMSIWSGEADVVAKTAVNTFMGATGGGLAAILHHHLLNAQGTLCVITISNGILTGLVSITAGCTVFQPETSLIVGSIGCLLYIAFAEAMLWMHIDDPVEAAAVHWMGGLWALISVGLFAHPDNMEADFTEGYWTFPRSCGIVYNCGTQWRQLAAQAVFALAVSVWAGGIAFILFGGFMIAGKLRLTAAEECNGLPNCPGFVDGQPVFAEMYSTVKWNLFARFSPRYRDLSRVLGVNMELEIFCRRRKTIKPALGSKRNMHTLEVEPDLLQIWTTRGGSQVKVGLSEPSFSEVKDGTEPPVDSEDSRTEEDSQDKGSRAGDQDSFVIQVDIGNGSYSNNEWTETETDAKLSLVDII